MKRKVKWLVYNGLFATVVYFATFGGNQNAANVVSFLCVVCFIFSWFTFAKDVQEIIKKKGRPVPSWLDCLFGMVVSFVLIWFGFWWSGSMYFLHSFMIQAAYTKALREEEPDVQSNP